MQKNKGAVKTDTEEKILARMPIEALRELVFLMTGQQTKEKARCQAKEDWNDKGRKKPD